MTPEESPKIVQKKGKAMRLNPDTYFYCRCGKSADGVFCDGAHEGSTFQPKRFSVYEPKEAVICMCKHTKSAPYCDGSHRKL